MDKKKLIKPILMLVGILFVIVGVIWGISILMDALIDTACQKAPMTQECLERLTERGKL